jgi:choline dehydrogenase-like flavoprotein
MGRCVGGTTTINSGTCYRPPGRVLRRWRRELGLEQLTEAALEPHLQKVEQIIGVERADPRYVGPIADVIARGCEALGWHRHGPLRRNAPDCDGASFCAFGCPTDAKRSANISYVPLALRYGANLVYNARARRVLVQRGRAVGVEAETRAGPLTVRAGAVVLAAGALLTPLLLQRQRLANSSGQVGRNLSIHPAMGVVALMPDSIRGYACIPQGYCIEEFHDQGLMFEGAFVPPDFAAASLTLVGPRFTEVMEALDRVAYFGFMIEDTSRGRVLPGLAGRPLVSYFLNRHDVAALKRGAEILCRIYLAAGASGVFPMISGFEEIHDLRDLQRLRRARLGATSFELTAHHPLGTCRMGADPRRSVVGPENECHDLPGLFISDGSAVPSALGVNPQVTIMALATRAARFVARRAAENQS